MECIFESVIDLARKNYSSFVFDDYKSNNPKLKKEIRDKIILDLSKLAKYVDIMNFFIKGSILTKNYTNHSDIDVYIQIKLDDNPKIKEHQIEKIQEVYSRIDNSRIEGIPYRVQYYITEDIYNYDNTEAVYDVLNNDWIKRASTKNINTKDYFEYFVDYVNKFRDFSSEIREGLIDYEILKDIPRNQVKDLNVYVSQKVKEIERAVKKLVETYNELRDWRNQSFSDDMTPSEIKKYGTKTNLPANVVFKMLERYHYNDLAKRIKKILGKGDHLTTEELESLTKIINKELLVTEEVELYKNNLYPQSIVKKRQQKGITGASRTSQNIVPKCHRVTIDRAKKKVDNAKMTQEEINVESDSPLGIQLIKKYRIKNPTGQKIVGANENNPGIKINFF